MTNNSKQQNKQSTDNQNNNQPIESEQNPTTTQKTKTHINKQ